MAAKKGGFAWENKICNAAQVGGIETSVLDDGAGRGVRIAWINTGCGLRYKVVIDRAMDIGDAFFNQHSLAWLSHGGTTSPSSAYNRGLEWLYSFGGGLLTTCGLSHIGGPESDESGERGIHGRISNCAASIESIVQPDPAAGKLDMSITGVIKESTLFGPNLELRRTISSSIGSASIRIKDVVTNRGSAAAPHMILYHCNFGWPLVDEGVDIVYKGKCQPLEGELNDAMFNTKHNYRKCSKPLESHKGGGQACGFIDVDAGSEGFCKAGLYNRKLSLALAMKYKKKQLPWLTNWQHWGFGDYVNALEPGTNPPTGQNEARRQKKLIKIAPSKSRAYELELEILTDAGAIEKFLKAAGE